MAKIAKSTKIVPASKNGNKRGRNPKPTNETPALCFERVIGGRLGKMVHGFKTLRNATASVPEKAAKVPGNGYYSTQEQWDWIFALLDKEMNKLRNAQKRGGNMVAKMSLSIPSAK